MSAAVAVLFIGGLTAGATALGPATPFSQVLGVFGLGATDENAGHGDAVSTAVHDALTNSTPGTDRGEAVSNAACSAAHDRTTLPEGAQAAPGIHDKDEKVCATETPPPDEDGAGPAEVVADPDNSSDGADSAEASPSVTPNHGDSVSGAVHDAIASTTPGPDRGPAVSEAACDAAHDRSTLPEGAQAAPGKQGDEPKDCTHSEPGSDGTPEVGSGTSNDTPPAQSPDTNPGEHKGQENGNGNSGNSGNGNSGNSGNGNSENGGGKPENPGEPDKGPDKDLPPQSDNKKP
jgi:uncharacterized membrane protein YgcG